jgi:SAM-dependent methyltransferase
MTALEARHLADLTFAEVARALRALSSAYVERRAHLAGGTALSGAGKRAAFALFYAPLHYLLVRHIVEALPNATSGAPALIDLGCGTGAAGAAWATACTMVPRVTGVDRSPWALAEATRTYRHFMLRGQVRRADIAAVPLPSRRAFFLAAFALNELPDESRDLLLRRLFGRVRQGDRVLVVEPLAGSAAPWWNRWREPFQMIGGQSDEWRFRAELPAMVAKLDRAAGLDHREITGRSLWSG